MLGKEGQLYVVYLKSGGSANIGVSADATYSVKWYDPRNGGALQTGSVTSFSGTGTKSLGNPPHSSTEDWVALVKKESSSVLFRINSGGPAYTTPNGITFSADANFSGGSLYSLGSTPDIGNTTSDALYRSERYGTFSYRLPVSSGNYSVILHFAEIYWGVNATGTRKFNVDIEGVRKLSDYNIAERAGGALKAVQETISVSVTDGTLNVDFYNGSADQAKISAIEVIPQGSTTGAAARTGNFSSQIASEITAYPNPSTGTIVIEGVETQQADFKILVTSGIRTYTPTFRITSPASVQVMLNGLKTGLYIIQVRQGGRDYFRKILIER
jgi:hypothetical protein